MRIACTVGTTHSIILIVHQIRKDVIHVVLAAAEARAVDPGIRRKAVGKGRICGWLLGRIEHSGRHAAGNVVATARSAAEV